MAIQTLPCRYCDRHITWDGDASLLIGDGDKKGSYYARAITSLTGWIHVASAIRDHPARAFPVTGFAERLERRRRQRVV